MLESTPKAQQIHTAGCCYYCNKHIIGKANRRRKMFCSRECIGKWKKEKWGLKVPCDNCGATKFMRPSDFGKNEYHFCSQKCRAEGWRKAMTIGFDLLRKSTIERLKQVEEGEVN